VYGLNVKNPVNRWGALGLQQGDCNVVHRHPPGRFAIALAIMRMAVDDQVCAVTVDYFGQARRSKEWINLRGFALDGGHNRSVVQHHHPLLGP